MSLSALTEHSPTPLIILFNFYLLYLFLRRVLPVSKTTVYPLSTPYTIPWIGALFAFVFRPLEYLRSSRLRFGPDFRIKVAGQTIIVVGTPAGIRALHLSSSKQIGPIDHQRLGKIAGLSVARTEQIFEFLHRDVFATATRNFRLHTLPVFTYPAIRFLEKELLKLVPPKSRFQEIDVFTLVASVIYRASIATFWGEHTNLLDTFEDFMEFERHAFPLLRNLPFGLKKLKAARARVIAALRSHIRENWIETDEGGHLAGASENISQSVRLLKARGLTEDEIPRVMFIIHWGTHGTLMGVATWVMIFLTSNPSMSVRIRDAICSVYPESPDFDRMQEIDLKVPLLDSAIKETMRLILLPMTVREALVDFEIPGDKGQRISVSAGEYIFADVRGMHLDPLIHPNPDEFVLERFLDKTANYGDFGGVKSLVPWGGGLFMCKGRDYAQRIMKLYFILFFQLCDIAPTAYALPETSPWSFTVLQPLVVPTIQVRSRDAGKEIERRVCEQ